MDNAILSQKYDVVKFLIDQGYDVNTKNKYGKTPIFYACDIGSFSIIRLLVDSGAIVRIKDNFNNEPIHISYDNFDQLDKAIRNGENKISNENCKFISNIYNIYCYILEIREQQQSQ